jgi:hypothetical protein
MRDSMLACFRTGKRSPYGLEIWPVPRRLREYSNLLKTKPSHWRCTSPNAALRDFRVIADTPRRLTSSDR